MDLDQRVARLEAQHEELMRLMKETHDDLKDVKDSLTKWKGIAGGIAITVSVFWAGLVFIADWMKR